MPKSAVQHVMICLQLRSPRDAYEHMPFNVAILTRLRVSFGCLPKEASRSWVSCTANCSRGSSNISSWPLKGSACHVMAPSLTASLKSWCQQPKPYWQAGLHVLHQPQLLFPKKPSSTFKLLSCVTKSHCCTIRHHHKAAENL